MAKKNKRKNEEKKVNLNWSLKVRELPIELNENEKALQQKSYEETNANIELLLNHAINGVRLAESVILEFNMTGNSKKLFNDISRCFNRAGSLICSSVNYEMVKLISDGIMNNYETGILNNILTSYVKMDDNQRNLFDNCGDLIRDGMTPQLSKDIDADFDQLNELSRVMQQSLGIVNVQDRLDYIKSKGFSIKVNK